uniref:Uncharacterized protein n=1 Tax=viral metagenome TaxID=1070528 RepID=A0A6H1ZLQ9_9ZZZZ
MKRLVVVKCPRCSSINILVLDSNKYICNECGHQGKKLRFPSSHIIVREVEVLGED